MKKIENLSPQEASNDLSAQSGEITNLKANEEITRLEEKASEEMKHNVIISTELLDEAAELATIEKQKQSLFGKFKSAMDSVRARLAGFKGEEASEYKGALRKSRRQKRRELAEGAEALTEFETKKENLKMEADRRGRVQEEEQRLAEEYGVGAETSVGKGEEEFFKIGDEMSGKAEADEEPYAEYKIEPGKETVAAGEEEPYAEYKVEEAKKTTDEEEPYAEYTVEPGKKTTAIERGGEGGEIGEEDIVGEENINIVEEGDIVEEKSVETGLPRQSPEKTAAGGEKETGIAVGTGEFKTIFQKGEKILYAPQPKKGGSKRPSGHSLPKPKEYTVVGPSKNKKPGLILSDGKKRFAVNEDAVINRVKKINKK